MNRKKVKSGKIDKKETPAAQDKKPDAQQRAGGVGSSTGGSRQGNIGHEGGDSNR